MGTSQHAPRASSHPRAPLLSPPPSLSQPPDHAPSDTQHTITMRLALAVFAALATLASAADPAPAPAMPPADGAPNFMYAFTTKTATFNPEKGTLTLKGLTDYAMAVATMPSGPSFSRREVGDLFGKTKRTPVFDSPAEVVIEGKKGLPSGHKLILSVSSPKLETQPRAA